MVEADGKPAQQLQDTAEHSAVSVAQAIRLYLLELEPCEASLRQYRGGCAGSRSAEGL